MTKNEWIGENIRRRIDEKGIKHAYVARKCGVSPAIFCKMLKGQRKIHSDDLANISAAIGCTCEDLIEQP